MCLAAPHKSAHLAPQKSSSTANDLPTKLTVNKCACEHAVSFDRRPGVHRLRTLLTPFLYWLTIRTSAEALATVVSASSAQAPEWGSDAYAYSMYSAVKMA